MLDKESINMCLIEELPVGARFVVEEAPDAWFEVVKKHEVRITVKINFSDKVDEGDVALGVEVTPIWFPVFYGDGEEPDAPQD